MNSLNSLTATAILSLLVLMTLATACGGDAQSEEAKTPKMRKAILEQQLNAKKADLSKLQYEIKELEKQMLALDPNFKQKEEEKKWRMVSTTPVQQKDFVQYSEFQGSVTTKGDFMVSSEIGGVLRTLTVKEGDYVKKGQLVATTDDATMRSNLAELQTQLNLAQDVYQRRKKLWDQNIGSELEYLQSKTQVESLQKSIATLQTQMAKTSVYSPNNGVVDMIMVKQGEITGPGTPIFSLINTANVQVTAAIPENYLKNIRRGERVKVSLPAIENEQTGRISRISSTINSQNRTFDIEVNISSKGGKVKPNLMALVEIKEFDEKNAITVPTNLILNDANGSYMFAVGTGTGDQKGKKVALRKDIKTGPSYNGETLVEEGLTKEDILITDGYRMVANNDPIKVVEDK